MSYQSGPPPTQLPPDVGDTGEAQPRRRRGRPPGSKTGSGAPSRRSLEPQIAATLMAMNLAVMVIPPVSRDALDEVEITALARALDAQAKQSPRFRRMLEGALAVTSGGQLLGVCMIIGARRAARHGVVPADMDRQLGNMLAMGLAKNPPQPPEPQPSSNGTA